LRLLEKLRNKNFIIVCSQNFFVKKIKLKNFFFITNKNKLNLKYINKIKPKIIFFPYWHWKVPQEIFDNFLCIGFHTSPLPYGRGGSPIQNQILLSKKKSTICAIKYNKIIDGGNIYLKKKISLSGSANEIFERIFNQILIMINQLIKKLPNEKKQKGKVTKFKRRTPDQSEIKDIKNISKLFDFIRMLDLDFKNFPKSFIFHERYKIEFSKVKFLNKENLVCQALISKRKFFNK